MFKVLDKQDVSYMDQILFDENGLIRVLPSADLLRLPQEHIMIWGNLNGVYTYPTKELIDWLKEKIDPKNTIEICSGNGAIGRALNIVSTDSYIQTEPKIVAFYKSLGQFPISPPKDVQKFEATKAVDFYNPKTVIASYATQISKEDSVENTSFFGVDEDYILSNAETYIHIGNSTTHGTKRIAKDYYNDLFRFPWLVTRSVNPEENEIRIFRNEKKYAK